MHIDQTITAILTRSVEMGVNKIKYLYNYLIKDCVELLQPQLAHILEKLVNNHVCLLRHAYKKSKKFNRMEDNYDYFP